MRLIATLACRNNSTRLYGKPLQRIGSKTVLEYIISNLLKCPEIAGVCLAISESKGNEAFIEYAESNKLPYVVGSDKDVLKRLIDACKKAGGDTVFRMTTESPFPFLEGLGEAVQSHKKRNADYTTFEKLPDGSAFEIINLSALERSHLEGKDKHRSEYCSMFVVENPDRFKINVLSPKSEYHRPDYRLTIDFPEDLIICRKIIAHFGDTEIIPFDKLIRFLDEHPELNELVNDLNDQSYVKFYF